jgi:thiol-disulfide isomerase/thioredoxin
MLYVATGDMEESSSAQDDGTVQGKILRMTPEGMIPPDNPSADSYVYAKGVRFARGVVVSAEGDVYASDEGETFDDSKDELNFVPEGGDLGWDAVSGDSGGTYDDPLVFWDPPFGAAGLSIYAESAFPDLAADGKDSDEDRYGPDLYPGARGVDDNGQGVCVGSNNNGGPCSSDADCPDERASFFTGLFTEEAYCAFPDDAAEYCPSGTPAGDDSCGSTGAAGTDEPDESYLNNLFLAAGASDEIVRAVLDPSDATALSTWSTFLDSSFLADCPTGWRDVMTGADGFLYAVADNGGGTGDGGLYRIIHDDVPGPREVAKTGTYFPLMIAESGGAAGELELTWEDLRSDAYQPRDDGADPTFPEREYTVWMGDLGNFYSHSQVPELDGVPGQEVNGALRSATYTPEEGNKYFLVSARGANLEGVLGQATDGTERPGAAVTDLCEDIGYHEPPDFLEWACGRDFTLVDEIGETHSLYELRGHVIVLDFSAMWCGPCQSEADVLENLHDDYKDRGVKVLTVLNDEPNSLDDWVGRPTPAECRDWSDRAEGNPDHTFPCFVDSLTEAGERKAWPNYNKFGAVPTNVILDRGLRVVYTTGGYPEGEIRDQLDLLVGTTDSCLQ